jgi:hypothetical protein
MKHILGALSIACLVAPGAFATNGSGSAKFVANNGIDSPTCGAAADPCRSISRGVANALAGDTVIVGPGRYGDIDFDGALASFGEETGAGVPGGFGGLYVNKAVTILSSDGAEATVIDVNNAQQAAVELAVDGVRFGERGHGFTLLGGVSYGLFTGRVTNVVVAGNLARNQLFGFLLGSGGVVEAHHNSAIGNTASGFVAQTFDGKQYVVLTNNVAIGNGEGINVGPVAAHRITANEISGNGTGLGINWGPSRISQNQVTANRLGAMLNGYSLDLPITQGPLLIRNNFVGNRANGIDVFPGPAGISPRLRENNIFGNGNCGTTNQTGATGVTVDARNNFWGAATGPSFTDPADPACAGAQPTLTTPFATREFDIR